MIKINGKEYDSKTPSDKDTYAILRLNSMTDEQIVELSADASKSVANEIRSILSDLDLRLPERVILMTIPLLGGEPNDYVVYLIDLYEKYFIGVPTLTRVINDIYPEGFYTAEALKERIEWIKANASIIKRPELLDYLVE